jgi:hypothetical protein
VAGEWDPVNVDDLKEGDVFRFYANDGRPVALGKSFKATADAKDGGVVAVPLIS